MPAASRGLVWSSPAERDLFDISNYLIREASFEIAESTVRAIYDRCEILREHPFTGRPRDDLEPGLRGVLMPPYIVFYRVTDAAIDIVRVLSRRDLEAALADRGG